MRRTDRALAPDLARGAMLLFIAIANAVGVVFAGELSAEPHPAGPERLANALLYIGVHARAYPMFAVLFGYGLVQLATRQQVAGATPGRVRSILLRRNAWLVLFGLVHAALLYSGDFLGAYGLVGLLITVLLLRHTGRRIERVVLALWAVSTVYALAAGAVVVGRLAAGQGAPAGLPATPVGSLAAGSYGASVLDRLAEWPVHTLIVLPFAMIVSLGMVAARRRILEDPAVHRTLLRRVAAGGLGIAFLGGLPLGLVSAGVLRADAGSVQAMTVLHGVSGMFGGPGYVALFGLLAARLGDSERLADFARPVDSRRPAGSRRVVGFRRVAGFRQPVVAGLAALGQRSLSGYLVQSVAWLLLLAPFSLDLAHHSPSPLFTALAVATLTWLGTVAMARRMGARPGPAEQLLRRLAYGPRRAAGLPGHRAATGPLPVDPMSAATAARSDGPDSGTAPGGAGGAANGSGAARHARQGRPVGR
jgi:uncharacterized protein